MKGADLDEKDPWTNMTLAEFERRLSSESERERIIEDHSSGESIAKALYSNRTGPPLNVIPGVTSTRCYGRLDVVVGEKDDLELMLLRALKHAAFSCRKDGTTANKFVVVKTAKWDPAAWLDCEQEFASLDCRVYKKELGSPKAQRLL